MLKVNNLWYCDIERNKTKRRNITPALFVKFVSVVILWQTEELTLRIWLLNAIFLTGCMSFLISSLAQTLIKSFKIDLWSFCGYSVTLLNSKSFFVFCIYGIIFFHLLLTFYFNYKNWHRPLAGYGFCY